MARFRNNRNGRNYNGYNNGYSGYNNSYIYGLPNVAQFAAVTGEIEMQVGPSSDLSNHEYTYENTVKCAEIYELSINDINYIDAQETLDKKNSSNKMMYIIFGVGAGIFALITIFNFIAYFRNKSKAKAQ